MIKYLEMTAPQDSKYRQAKIISIEVNENDHVEIGDTLFKVKSGDSEIDLPSVMAGRVVEVIAFAGDIISSMTPLVLLETEVETSTASKPTVTEEPEPKTEDAPAPSKSKKKTKKKSRKKDKKAKKKAKKAHKQQSLNLDGNDDDNSVDDEVADVEEATNETEQGNDSIAQPADNASTSQTMNNIKITVPDIGADSAKVIEILVNKGDTIAIDDSIITLESDKASMDVPSTHSGVVTSISVNIDDDLSTGDVILEIETSESEAAESNSQGDTETTSSEPQKTETDTKAAASTPAPAKPQPAAQPNTAPVTNTGKSHASPSIRRFARELGVDLGKVAGTGRKGRINKADVSQFVKNIMTGASSAPSAAASGGAGIPEVPAIDFTQFGEIDVQKLNRIKQLTATNLHRSWLNVPHVTHNDESNISELESFRKELNAEYASQNRDIKLSPLAFIVKAVVSALRNYPQFNSSLDPSGENLIYKKYCNIGIAVETPNGLVVPVIKDADKKSITQLAEDMGELAAKARDKKLKMADMSGACFTISSLGGIGGTSFTPIVNAPEVAILGVSRSKMQPVWNGEEFEPGMMLPLSLSYDHRVIDGAEAARFTRHIAAVLEDVRRLTV